EPGCRFGFRDLATLTVQPAGQRTRPVADDERPLWLMAQEAQPFDHVHDDIVDHEPRRVRALLQPGDAPPRRTPPCRGEDDRGSARHGLLLPVPSSACKAARL